MKPLASIAILLGISVALSAPANAQSGPLSQRVDQLESEVGAARLRGNTTARRNDLKRLDREIRQLETITRPFFGIKERTEQVMLKQLKRRIDQIAAGDPRPAFRLRTRTRRTTLMDKGPLKLSIGLDALD